MPDWHLETLAVTDGCDVVCGVDEAGRGPWAGPVVAGAVIINRAGITDTLAAQIDDSKKLKEQQREDVFNALGDCCDIGVGIAAIEEIDRINILQATMLAMGRAVSDLSASPGLALVDGNRAPNLICPVRTVVKGDGLSLSIAAASIVAKVTRDRIMADLASKFPGYGWERNKGYGTAEHKSALDRLGITPHHRKSFAPIIKILSRAES